MFLKREGPLLQTKYAKYDRNLHNLLGATHVRLNLLMSFAVWLMYFAACVQLYIFLRSICFFAERVPSSGLLTFQKERKKIQQKNYGRSGVRPAHLLSVRLMFGSSLGAEYHGNIYFRTLTTQYKFHFCLKKTPLDGVQN